MTDLEDENWKAIDNLFKKITVTDEMIMWKEIYNKYATFAHLLYDSIRSQGFDTDQSFDLTINMILSQYESFLRMVEKKQ